MEQDHGSDVGTLLLMDRWWGRERPRDGAEETRRKKREIESRNIRACHINVSLYLHIHARTHSGRGFLAALNGA